VCIDFGTYGTSYAFAYTNDPKDPKTIYVESHWDNHDGMYFKNKTLNLYEDNGNSPTATGFTADYTYFYQEEEGVQYTLMRNFKLGLYRCQEEFTDPVTGRTFKLVDLIGDYLSPIREKLMKRINQAASVTINREDIRFVITVPAIWNDQAKAIMKKSLVKAGIIDAESGEDDYMFVLEPEAASTFCLKEVFETYHKFNHQ
jgi:hypothetical protein